VSLLDAAREWAEDSPLYWISAERTYVCAFCYVRLFDPTDEDDKDGNIFASFKHEPYCPWLSMPKIVAVLEAADRMAKLWQRDIERRDDTGVSPAARLGQLGMILRELNKMTETVEKG